MLQKKKKKPKNIALWVSCKLQITDLSYYERFHSPGVSKCSGRVTHLRGQILEILWKGQAHKCYNRKFVSKAHPLPAASPTAHTTTGTLQMSHSPTISSTIWEITTVPKVLKKKKKRIPKSYGLCCLTTTFAVSMYKLIRVGVSPLPLTVKL